MTDRRVSELEGRWIEIIQYGKQKNNVRKPVFPRITSKGWILVLLESLLEDEYKDIGVGEVLEEWLGYNCSKCREIKIQIVESP